MSKPECATDSGKVFLLFVQLAAYLSLGSWLIGGPAWAAGEAAQSATPRAVVAEAAADSAISAMAAAVAHEVATPAAVAVADAGTPAATGAGAGASAAATPAVVAQAAPDAATPPATPPPKSSDKNYHTPRAGGGEWTTFLRETIHIPTYDRADLTSITLGGSVLFPKQGRTGGLPVGALYIRRYWEDSRTRDIISIAVNELEYAKRWGHVEAVGHFENYTLPNSFKEIEDNHKFQETAVTWGDLLASVGPGLRWEVRPFEVDNDLKLQLLGRVGYFYAEKGHGMGPDVVVPPDTLLYGARVRGRYDGMLRNLLELPHRGNAVGFDADIIRRDKWKNLEPATTDSVHNEYLQVKGYYLGASGIPGLNERNRVLLYANAGTINHADADRYNAFTVNGGPFPSEADDLIRTHYTGLLHDDVRAISYATASLAYRRELTFFLYMSLVGSYIWGERATVVGGDQVVFRDKTGAAGTVSFDTAMIWNSQLYIGYTWESGFIRNGRSGSGVTVFWNKLF